MRKFKKPTVILHLVFWALLLTLYMGHDTIVRALGTEDVNPNGTVNELFVEERIELEADATMDELFTEQFLTYHTEYFNEGDALDIQFIGSFCREDDLDVVSHRVYHVSTATGEPLVFFYARMDDQFITHVGRGLSNYYKLQEKIVSSLNSPIEDLRFILSGITEVVYVKEAGVLQYQMASVCEPELVETDFLDHDDILRFHQDCELRYEEWKKEQQAIEEARIPEDEEGWQVLP